VAHIPSKASADDIPGMHHSVVALLCSDSTVVAQMASTGDSETQGVVVALVF